MIINLKDGFYAEAGIVGNEVDFISSSNVFAYDKNGVDNTIMNFMTGNQYCRYLITQERFYDLYKMAFNCGRNVIWSGEINKYFPQFLFKNIMPYKPHLNEYKEYGHLFSEEKKFYKALNPAHSGFFDYGYENFKTNKFNLSLESSVTSLCAKLNSVNITIKLHYEYFDKS